MSLRLDEDEAKYQQAKNEGKLVSLLEVPAKVEYKYWKIIANDFPHTKISEWSDMLILKRKALFSELKFVEIAELFKLIVQINESNAYHKFELNFTNMQSVKDIVHFHLQYLKDEMK
jgi:hypothetical protein